MSSRPPLLVESSKRCCESFAAAGGTVIDSSPMYGRSEQVVGDLVKKLGLRDRLFIATKVWTTGKAAGIRQMEASMQKLGVSQLDLMQVHNLVDVATHLDTLEEWKEQRRVRYVGVTHYTAGSHDAVAKVLASHTVDFVQINYSVAEREAERRLLPMALERGIAVLANRPFAEGALIRRLRSRALPELGSGDRVHELGGVAAQVRGVSSRRDLRDPGDIQSRITCAATCARVGAACRTSN